jgi:hypothetical protein
MVNNQQILAIVYWHSQKMSIATALSSSRKPARRHTVDGNLLWRPRHKIKDPE